jgi:hypothetical protein
MAGYRKKSSYLAKSITAKSKQLSGLRQFRNKDTGPKLITLEEMQAMDIITFAVDVLGLSFTERPAQETLLRAFYGLPLSDAQIEIYKQITTNQSIFEASVEKVEGCFVLGARSGKSTAIASVIALYESICRGHIWRRYLNEGEIGYAIITATRQQQSEQVIQAACTRLLENSKAKFMIKDSLQASLLLANGLCIASAPCNSTAMRGIPIFLLIFDEIAFYRLEGVKADEAIHSSLRPRQAQFERAKCLKISTPAGKQGLFWDEFSEGFQVAGRLTVQAATRVMNPLVSQDFIDKEYRRDPDNAAREFGAQFAETVEGFFASCQDKLAACFQFVEDVPYQRNQTYIAGIDQSGLSGHDRFSFSICHRQKEGGDRVIQDVLRVWNTKEADVALEQVKGLCSVYHTTKVYGDAYASGWVSDGLKKVGLEFEVSERAAVIYSNLKTLVLLGRLSLQDDGNLQKGLFATQAYYGKSNQLSIGHERTSEGHGDSSDATARAIYYASQDYTVKDLNDDNDYSPLVRNYSGFGNLNNYNPLSIRNL